MACAEFCMAVRKKSKGCQQGKQDHFSLKVVSKFKPDFQPEQLITCPLPLPAWSVPSLRAQKEVQARTLPDLKHRQNKEKKIIYF